MGIQINGNTNNINAGIGSLSIEDINELDIVGVATAANFKTGVSNLHSVGLTLSGGQIDVGSNIKLGTAGVVTATSFVGSGANLTSLPSQLTLANNADNRVITGGSGTNLNGEANLTFDGTTILKQQFTATNTYAANDTTQCGYQAHNLSDTTNTYAAIRLTAGSSSPATAQIASIRTGTGQNDLTFQLETGNTAFEAIRITSAGKLGIGDNAPSSDLSIKSSAPGILLTDTSGTGQYANIDFDSTTLILTARNNTSTAPISFRGYDGTNIKTYMNLTTTGNVITYNNHLSGTSGHNLTSWYGDDANHYTLEHKDFNEIRAIKTVNTSDYNSIVYKREAMTEYCDIEFTLKGNVPSGAFRHFGMVINGDGSDTSSNWDRLIFRYRPSNTGLNQIRLDKGGGGYGFTEENSSVPNFFDGNERHIHIQIRKRTFSITVNRQGHTEYNFSTRSNADLVAPRGYFGFIVYEASSAGNPEVTLRDFKITNYTQNAIPTQSVAFQATHSGNPSKNSGYMVKPCNVEAFDNGYGGNFNTSNYRFTAPVAGVYQFSNVFNCYSAPSNMFCSIRVNGSTQYIGNKRNNNTGNGDQNVTAYCIVQLQKGDYVEAYDNTSNGVTYSSGVTWNRFEGSLIAAYK